IAVGTLVAFPSYAWLLRAAPTSVVSTYAYVNPVVAVALGWGFAGEQVRPVSIVAGAIIVAAVAMIVTARRVTEPGEPAAGIPPVDEPGTDAPGMSSSRSR
ncbi:MAG: EamA family transporter, partial [Actinomycetota bacterium]